MAEHLILCGMLALHGLPDGWPGTEPAITGLFGDVAEQFATYDVILQPDTIAPEWWAGAPSVVRDGEGVFWLACRMRTADAPRGLRGYEIRVLRSEDGIHFEPVHRIGREDVPIPGFERSALVIDPDTGQFKLYGCGPWQEGPWSIIKFDDVDRPDQFDPASARPVVTAPEKTYERDVPPAEYKDPVVIHAGGAWHMYVIGVVRRTERIFHFTSDDGETWRHVGNPYEPVMQLDGWHNFYVRPASVLPVGPGYLFIYEGSHVSWYDPVFALDVGRGRNLGLCGSSRPKRNE